MKKMINDVLIMILSVILMICTYYYLYPGYIQWTLFISLGVLLIFIVVDFLSCFRKMRNIKLPGKFGTKECRFVHEIILLDEQNRPIKSWNLTDKVAMLIGKENEQEPIDIDLSDCEYSALIDSQHAVLNFCKNAWYIEDLYSQNGLRIQKAEDGICYHVAKNRPCLLLAGDIVYIAKTKLLIT